MLARVSKRARESVLVRRRGLFSAGRQTVRGSPLALLNLFYFATEFRSVLTSIRKQSHRGSIHWLLGRIIFGVVSSVKSR
jgi:hypothetical protein